MLSRGEMREEKNKMVKISLVESLKIFFKKQPNFENKIKILFSLFLQKKNGNELYEKMVALIVNYLNFFFLVSHLSLSTFFSF